jgi:hypothetical protein
MTKTLVVGGLLVALLIPSAFAVSKRTQAGVLCVELRGNADTRRDVKFRNSSKCKAGEKKVEPTRGLRGRRGPAGPAGAAGPAGPAGPQGPPGAPAPTPEYAVVGVYVDRGSGPSRWALYSVALNSPAGPAGTTTGGTFRFTCSTANQAPCKISYGAAVLSGQSGNAGVYPRLLIYKQADAAGDPPVTYCEYADGANNNLGLAVIPRVQTMADAVIAMRTPLSLGIGGSLDCESGQPPPPPLGDVTEIWVPSASAGNATYYDVTATFVFGSPYE